MLTTKVLVLLVLLGLYLSQKTPLAILSVSGDPMTVQNPVYSSLRGGRMIYIKAMGHSPDPTHNTVLVGNIPCKIPSDGVTLMIHGSSILQFLLFTQTLLFTKIYKMECSQNRLAM